MTPFQALHQPARQPTEDRATVSGRRHWLGSLAAALAMPSVTWVSPAWASPAERGDQAERPGHAKGAERDDRASRIPRKSVPLILAQEAPDSIDPAGWLVSEKFDGVRAWWDGRVLRFRSGLKVAAPEAFLKMLPPVPLDGELWLGRGRFDELSGIVRQSRPDPAVWQAVRYMVFELPGAGGRFDERARALRDLLAPQAEQTRSVADSGGTVGPRITAVEHSRYDDRQALRAALDRVVGHGGEGLMLHRADAPEVHGRSPLLLKLKPLHDDEAVVIGHQSGTGRLAGRLGALRVRDDAGRVFEVGTGLTDAQRAKPPAIGSRITFSHRGRTPAGVPRFAVFLRERSI